MKKILCLISVLILIFAVVSCDKKKKDEIPGYEEQVSKEIKADEGGTVESSDGKTSVEIPGGALDEDTTITMTIRSATDFPNGEGEKLISMVLELEPSGTVFKKPILITMPSSVDVNGNVITAAVFHEAEETWSYSETGNAVMIAGKDAAGDPIMQSAAGDPIMLNAAGDPIMMSAAGDQIMLSAAGDPIMVTAAGDPIMMSAAGDPIMMTTGHFTAYTFIAIDPKEPGENDDDEPVAETDDDEPVDDSDTDTPEPTDDTDTEPADEDIVPEPDPVYSKVICTGLRTCFDKDGKPLYECPKDGAMSGQDAAYIFRKSCVTRSFEVLPVEENDSYYPMTKDNNTGLTWLFSARVQDRNTQSEHSEFCSNLEYDGHDDWRLPTPQELMTISDYDIFNIGSEFRAFRASAFPAIAGFPYGWRYFWTSKENFYYSTEKGEIAAGQPDVENTGTMCVRGEEYGKVAASDYTSKNENGQEMILDSKTNLYWQKTPVNGKKWDEALSYCENLEYAGKSDWRLPNRNELATLIDYSRSNPASSFPGMPSQVFATSTYTTSNGAIAIDMNSGATMAWTDGGYYVICVRSDLASYPENWIPECGDDGYAPCKLNGVTWSQRLYYDLMENGDPHRVHWATVARDCRSMKGGKWRIPTIGEIRTLFTDDVFKTGGSCGVTNNCNDIHCQYVDFDGDGGEGEVDTCFSEAVMGTETKLHDNGRVLSGTLYPEYDRERGEWTAWDIDMQVGEMLEDVMVYASDPLVARCVWDDSIEVPEDYTSEMTDSATGNTFTLNWSSISPKGTWRDAVEYCGTLVEGGSDYWKIPSQEELGTLLRNYDPDEPAEPDLIGKYSVFNEIPLLMSRDFWNDSISISTLDFIDGYSDYEDYNSSLLGTWKDIQVRCVRKTTDPTDDPNKKDEDSYFPHPTYYIVWSKKSDLITGTIEDARKYCNDLTTEKYGVDEYGTDGEITWFLPTILNILEIIDDSNGECEAGAEVPNLLPGEITSCVDVLKASTHSDFNDYGKFWTSESNSEYGNPYLFNFTTAEIVGGESDYNSGYVRCVAYTE